MPKVRRRTRIGLALAAIAVLSGCSGPRESHSAPTAPAAPTVVEAQTESGPLPPPEALTAVIQRLADPAVPGAEKLTLVAGAATTDSVSLDSFAAALRDGGYTPVTVAATDLIRSDIHPGDVRATVTITGPDPKKAGDFRFPLEFRPYDGGWQLTRETADMLLVFGP